MNSLLKTKKSSKKSGLITISRKEYESLLGLKKNKEFKPTPSQKKALLMAEMNLKKGKTLSYNELAQKLGFRS